MLPSFHENTAHCFHFHDKLLLFFLFSLIDQYSLPLSPPTSPNLPLHSPKVEASFFSLSHLPYSPLVTTSAHHRLRHPQALTLLLKL